MFLPLLTSAAFAQSSVAVRSTRLQDGREFVAEVLGTESTGLRVRVPSGQMLVSFEDLVEVRPAEESAYATQPSWKVVLAATDRLAGPARQMIDAMPGVVARVAGKPDPDLNPENIEALAGCGLDVGCMRTSTASLPWRWLLVVDEADGVARVTSIVSTSDRSVPKVQTLPQVDAESLWTALHVAIGLDAPRTAPPAVEGLVAETKPDRVRPERTASPLVPIPGWPAFRAGDPGRGAAAMGGAFVFAGAVGASSLLLNPGYLPDKADELQTGVEVRAVLLGGAGFLAATWALNQWCVVPIAKQASLVPTPSGVSVAGSF